MADHRSPLRKAASIEQVSERLASITSVAAGQRRNPLAAYMHLVQNNRFLVPTVWPLINLRNSPVWIFPLLIGHVFDVLSNPQQRATVMGDLWWVMTVSFLLCVMNVITTVGERRLRSIQGRALAAALRRSLVRRLHKLTFAFHDRAQAGILQNKFLLDIGRLEAMQNYLAECILMQGTTIVVTLVIVAQYNPWFLLVLGLIVPANLLTAHLLWPPMRRRSEEFRVAESGFVASLNEALHGVRVTRAHAVEDYAERRLESAARKVATSGVRVDVTHAFFGSCGWAVGSLLNMAVIGVGAWLCVRDEISYGALFIFWSYYGIISGAVSGIIYGMPTVAGASDALQSLSELYESESEERNDGKPALESVTGEVRLTGVHFRYAGSQRHSLGGVDLHIPVGTSLALVGPSGSGKSTIASLILGFYDPEQGMVSIDGHDLRSIDRRTVRKHVGVVSQDVVLFHDTVAGNIAWGDEAPDPKRIQEAAERANADSFISELPNGYDTTLGDRGMGLSGGQRQRLAIARALYRDPKLLILDEATSALDPESERLVQQALDVLMQGRSSLIIAHRLSTVRNADCIAVLDEGRVVETGTYTELMAKQGAFYRLASGQLS
ncbi:MAG TPA: ABC transporter ATP-binding protein [Planctomycetota bacterium]|nr:ABC transporter ATP-binding protein [Planctomycetota bacterium]